MDAEVTRFCPKCGVAKSTLEFYWFRSGVSGYCKPCWRQKARDVRCKLSPDERAEKRVKHKIWEDADKRKNPAKYLEKSRRDRARNPDAAKRRCRESRARNRDLAMFRSAMGRAKTRGWDFTITRSWLRQKLEFGVCEATGLAFANGDYKGAGHADPFSASLDRRDSTKGYTPENCRLILWGLNMALSQWGDQVYAEIATAYLSKKAIKING